MKRFEVTFSIGDNEHVAHVTPEIRDSGLIYTCLINDSVLFSIRKNHENRWVNDDGDASALCRLLGWEIDHYLKKVNLKNQKPVTRFDLYF